MNTVLSKNTVGLLHFLMFALVFLSNTLLIYFVEISFWLLPFVVVQGLLWVGLIEMFHQTVHMNFFTRRDANVLVGSILGGFFGIGFFGYRGFHLRHHQATNTCDDPELVFYDSSEKTIPTWLALICSPFLLFRYAGKINSAGIYFSEKDKRNKKLDSSCRIVFLALMVMGLLVFPVTWLKLYLMPFITFSVFEFLLAQSQHYRTPASTIPPRGKEHYIVGNNIALPKTIEFLVLFTNLHAAHHARPALKWYEVARGLQKDISCGAASPPMKWSGFLRLWFVNGCKVSDSRAEENVYEGS